MARTFRRISSRPWLGAALVGGSALLFAVAGTAARGFPPPREHDEYSYLLGAETFASGRLTNPTHPMWRHFETFHVLQQPTYNSKYPPGNALFIAAGWVVAGHPIAGVWFSFIFMCVAIYWMLRAWLGASWGLGVSLAFASWVSLSYWSYSYWGGAVAAGASALMLGALHRIVRGNGRGHSASAIMFGAGLLLLANSRPYEGLLVALPALVVLAHWLWRGGRATWRPRVRAVIVPLAIVGATGVFCMARYNRTVTGHSLTMPYVLYQQTRGGSPLFSWQRPHQLAPSTDPTMRAFMAWEDSSYQGAREPASRMAYLGSFATDFVHLVVPFSLLLPLLLLPIALRNRWTRLALGTVVLTVAGMGLSTYFNPHYAAPLVGLILVAYGACLRWLARLRIGRQPLGAALAASIVGLWFVAGVGRTARHLLPSARASLRESMALEWPAQRRLIADTLSRSGRQNVVIVRYGDGHGSGNEWVYNAADIEASPVVWARDMGDAANRQLLDYFHDRAAWTVDVNDDDTGPYPVRPYGARAP